jgi:acetoin utilization protein AcuC
VVEAVPRAWTHLLAIVTGEPLAPDLPTPDEWQNLAHRRRPMREVPQSLTDGGDASFAAWQPTGEPDAVDRAILATRRAVFPLHGLDPHDPRD